MNSPYDDLPKTQANYAPLTPLTFIERAAYVYPNKLSVVYGTQRWTSYWRTTSARTAGCLRRLRRWCLWVAVCAFLLLSVTPASPRCLTRSFAWSSRPASTACREITSRKRASRHSRFTSSEAWVPHCSSCGQSHSGYSVCATMLRRRSSTLLPTLAQQDSSTTSHFRS